MAKTRFTSLRNAFLTGLLVVAPLVATVWAVMIVIDVIGGRISPIFSPYLPEALSHMPPIVWDILTTVIVLAAVTLLGYVSHLFLGQFVGAVAERLIHQIPGIGGFYNTIKQLVDTFGAPGRSQFSKVVLVRFPHTGAYTIGFVTNTDRGEPHAHLSKDHWAVFVPTCPSPTNGYFLYLPRTEVIELEMSVGDGMKTVISCGAVLPEWKDPAAAKAALKKTHAH